MGTWKYIAFTHLATPGMRICTAGSTQEMGNSDLEDAEAERIARLAGPRVFCRLFSMANANLEEGAYNLVDGARCVHGRVDGYEPTGQQLV